MRGLLRKLVMSKAAPFDLLVAINRREIKMHLLETVLVFTAGFATWLLTAFDPLEVTG